MKPTEYSGDVESVAFGKTSFMDVSERVKTVPTQLCESNQPWFGFSDRAALPPDVRKDSAFPEAGKRV
jgi:hypothetical protein